jgi:gliding motility-associated-like protein
MIDLLGNSYYIRIPSQRKRGICAVTAVNQEERTETAKHIEEEIMATLRYAALLCCLMVYFTPKTFSQTVSCPTNIDFELGNFTNWRLYTGTCCAINTPTLSGPVTNRHVITSGTAVDPFGGFPIVSPGSGSYSMRLGNSGTGSQAERARYHVRVPNGVNDYSLIFRYAVVFQDPSHTASQQPRFEVKAYDSITNAIVNCSQFTYVATSTLPGFILSGIGSNVWYKSWTTASIDLSGYAGRTVTVDFATGDCALGAHFGYGYVDLDCGLFKINTVACVNSPTTTLTAPPGFQSYTWKDSTLTTTLGTGQTVIIPTPSTTTKYAVILTPYTGYGCPDTLFTTVTVQNLNIAGRNDTTICLGDSVFLNNTVTGDGAPFTYSWSPTTGLSCSTCAIPKTSPTADTRYVLTVTNANGCTKTDTIGISVSDLSISTIKQNITCNGAANGSITVNPANGNTPYAYSWNTSPIQTTQTISGLNPGIYSIKVTDAIGCFKTKTDTITQPTLLVTTKTQTNINCYNQNTGKAKVTASGGTAPYTYSWSSGGSTTDSATNLATGTYIVTTTDNKGCSKQDTFVITQPPQLTTSVTKSDVSCNAGNNGTASVTVTGGTTPYLYSWNTSPVRTTATINNLYAGTYTSTVTDNKGCTVADTVLITQPAAINTSFTKADVNCYGGNNGSIILSASGGTNPYTYSWNTTPTSTTATITNLIAGTYIGTTTDGQGCSKKDTIIITQPTILTRTKQQSNINCFGETNGTAKIVLSGGTQPYSYSWNTSPISTTDSIGGLGVGTYIVVGTDNKGCSLTDTFQITAPTKLSSSKGKNDVSCYLGNNGLAYVIASGGTPPYTYEWNTNPVRNTSAINNLNAGTYISTITDDNRCTKKDTLILTEPPLLTVTHTKTNVNCHNGSNGSINLNISGGSAPYTIVWNTIPVQSTTNISGLKAGIYIATITDSKGCLKTDTTVITEPLLLSASVSRTNVSCYNGSNGSATVLATGGTLPYTYIWNTNPVRTTSTISGVTAGTYIVVVTDSLGCSVSDSVTITQPTLLTNTKTKTDVSCYNGTNGTASVIASGGTPGYTYSWNTSPVKTTPTVTGLNAGTYIVTINDTNNCTKYDTVVITQPTQLISTLTKTNASCNGDTNGSAIVMVNGATPPYTYVWSNGKTTASNNNLGVGRYIVTITDSKGCNKSDTADIIQPNPLNATLTKNDISCYSKNDGDITTTVNGGTTPYSFSWNTTPVSTSASLSGLKPGNYILTITDEKGCKYIDSTTITEPPLLNILAKDNGKICVNYSTGSINTVTVGGTSPYTYLWSNGSTLASPSGLSAGTHIVTVTDNNGCTATDTATILNFPETVIEVSPDDTICIGEIVLLSVKGAKTYTWTPSTTLSCNTCTTPIAKPNTSTDYTVVGVDSNSCLDTATIKITVVPKLPVSVGPEINVCEGDEIQLNASGGIAYEWTPEQTLNNSKIASPVSSTDTNTRYRVVITENECFKDTLYQDVVIHKKPTVELGPDLKGTPGSVIQLHADVTKSNIIKWTPAEGLNCYDCIDPLASLSKTITYTATVYTDYCEAKDDITIRVACDDALFFIPNTFTPNEDGANDKFYPSASGVTNIDIFRVYNRWGEKIYEARDFPPNKPEYGWDGTYKGKAQWPDVFVYFIESRCANGEKIFLKGDISLIR